MHRKLCITICGDLGQSLPYGAIPGAAGKGWDPKENEVMPPPEDPKENEVMPPPEDPKENEVMPPPEDTSAGFHGRYRGAGPYPGHPLSPVVSAVHACGCGCGGSGADAQPAGAGSSTPDALQRDWSGFVIVRMASGLVSENAETLWQLAHGMEGLEGLKAALEVARLKPAASGEDEEEETAGGGIRGLWPKWPKGPDGGSGEGGSGSGDPTDPDFEDRAEDPAWVLKSAPLIDVPGCGHREATVRDVAKLERAAVTTPFPPRHSLNAYWRVDLRPYPERVEEVVAALNRLAEVDLAYREVRAVDPQVAGDTAVGHAFEEDQGYLDDAPVGIGARWAWEQLSGTHKIKVIDLEQGWQDEHNELPGSMNDNLRYGDNRIWDDSTAGEHGTAVVGQLVATGAGTYGVRGAYNETELQLVSHYHARKDADGKELAHPFPGTNGHVAAAIVNAWIVGKLEAGDVLLLEVQRGGWPTEIDEADLDAIRLASALGVIVVEAAGNGGYDLDRYRDPATGRVLRRRSSGFVDSGAILVGAAYSALPHDRASFSNYGSRVDCYAWGEGVTTCGYGDLAGQKAKEFYTNTFSGTSSAAPVIAGAAALVQHLHHAATGHRLMPGAMRAVLSDPATGSPQGPNVPGHIGVMPNLAALARHHLQLVPDVYIRRSVCDDGSQPCSDDEVSSSPDIIVTSTGEPPGEGPASNDPAPGSAFDPGNPRGIYGSAKIHVRLRNRGGGQGRARVQLFASPAATLITPERWAPLGTLDVTGPKDVIPQGDALSVRGRLDLSNGNLPPVPSVPDGCPPIWDPSVEPPCSFLAVQRPLEATPCSGMEQLLPPGPPWFDWRAYRAFLRGPGVAWRNAYGVKVDQLQDPESLTLAFLLAGTPDRARHFDFEVLQRLPAGLEVTLQAPPALVAKLRQRQGSLQSVPPENGNEQNGNENEQKPPENGKGRGDLVLPRRSRTTFRRLHLSAGVCVRVAFHLEVANAVGESNPIPDLSALAPGHSLAIRQLWRGEEVGRITWWFVEATP